MKCLSLLLLVFHSLDVYAQWGWAQSPVQGNARSNDIATDKYGNAYIAGNSTGAEFNGLAEVPYGGFYVLKIDSNGSNIWTKTQDNTPVNSSFVTVNGSDAECIAIDIDGNIFVSGIFSDTLKVDGHVLINQTSNQSSYFILKLDSNGTAEWLRQANGVHIRVWDMATDTAGSVYLCGGFQIPFAQFDSVILYSNASLWWPVDYNSFVVKYFSNGDFAWAKGSGGDAYDFAYGITTTPQGWIYVAGEFLTDKFYLGADTLHRYGSGNYYLLKYDLDGNAIWVRTSDESTRTGCGADVSNDSLGNAYLCTLYYDSLKVGPFHVDTGGYTYHAMILIKYTPSGSVEWLNSVNDVTPWSSATDKNGNTIISSWDDVELYPAKFYFDSIEVIRPYTPNNGVFVSWCNSDGHFECASVLKTTGISGQVAIDNNRNGYYTNYFWDVITVGSTTLYNNSSSDIQMFYARFNCDIPDYASASEIINTPFKVFPNPASNTIHLQLDVAIKNFTTKIYNSIGQLLIETQNEQTLDINELNAGLYVIQIQTEQGTLTGKFVKH